ncbi:hypothetical protein OU994_23730 [Pseudoduganella sp. SL102]|uniref:hypothetical protein n=1 Tax=Pseudoduganella sp. SL102 TaxID=2995154 RepID=UPI00248C1042|nr:hypothetical protein [Pseudoduganella sp. SL102]WBS01272.1 hypothetical protein OU994_23730 [Pseudoduganella sp. SL102]
MAARIALVVFSGFQILDFTALTLFKIANQISGIVRHAVEKLHLEAARSLLEDGIAAVGRIAWEARQHAGYDVPETAR